MIPLSEDDAQRAAVDAMLKADGWCLSFYITDGAGNDIPDYVTNAKREVPYILTRALRFWEDTLGLPPMPDHDDEPSDDDDLD